MFNKSIKRYNGCTNKSLQKYTALYPPSLQQLLPLLGDGVQLELQQVLGGGEQLLVALRLHLLGERGQLQQVSLQQRTHRIDVNCL